MSKDEKATSTKKTNGKNADRHSMKLENLILSETDGSAEKEEKCVMTKEEEDVDKTNTVMVKNIKANNATTIVVVANNLNV
jgi:hypothetical protein